LPYIGQIYCSAQDTYGDEIYFEGSASLLAEKGNGAFILTNYHVIEPIIGDYRANCFFSLSKETSATIGLYELDIQHILWGFNNYIDFAVIKIVSAVPGDFKSTPLDSLSSDELSSIPSCPIKMPLGSSVAVIGYPITARSQIDFTNQFGERESASMSNEAVTTGIISSHDSNPIYNGYPDVNYFVSAKIDKGNSGGLAFSKYNG
jgi:S1-C subfamily serine protease